MAPRDSLLPPNSLVLVTGVNGLIASHVADQFITSGFRVRGTVRDIEKCKWLEPLFESRHGPGRLELIQVADLGADGAWDEAIQGVAGVASVASSANIMVADVDAAVKEELSWFHSLLSAAKNSGTVKSFAFTSSLWTAYTPVPNVPMTISETTWNEAAVRMATDPNLSPEQKGISPFMAVKVRVEQGCWAWIRREKPNFRFNALLLDTVLGPILDAKNQPASTAGFVKSLWDGSYIQMIRNIAPQWFIDARDAGKLYVAALTNPTIENERLFGCAEKYSWHKILELCEEMYPEKEFLELEDAGWDETTVPNERARSLLQELGLSQWTSLAVSVKDNVDSLLDA